MDRRRFMLSTTAAAAGVALTRVPAWAQAPATPAAPLVTAFTELRRGVGVFTATGGTIGYLVNGDGAVAVDSQYMPNAEICVAGLKQRAPKGIALLINTHHHADHTGGNLAFKSSVQKIVAHEACAAWHRKTAEQAGTLAQQAIADTTFTETWKTTFGDETIHARYYGAGHTSGDAVITFEKANVVHMGDLLFNRAHPNIDRPAGANLASWIRALEQASDAASSDTIFIAGHAKEHGGEDDEGRRGPLRQLPDGGAGSRTQEHARRPVEGGVAEDRDAARLRGQHPAQPAPVARVRAGRRLRRVERTHVTRAAAAARERTREGVITMGRRNVMVFGFVAALGAAVMAQAPPRPTPVWTEKSAGNWTAGSAGVPRHRARSRRRAGWTTSPCSKATPPTFYVGTATGGVYKTTNHGTTFTSVFDHEGSSSVGDLAIAPTDANLVWVGTGENNNRQSSSWGDGIYKSADGGRSWKNMGLRASKQIARIIVDPVDFNVVYVAALGDLWAAGGERGVYKTTDGGQNWQRVLHVDDDTGATELVMDPTNNKTLYAATYQRRRAQWGMNGGGPGSTIWKSTDGGQTWAKAETGLPAGAEGPHRPRHLPQEPERALRARRARHRERRLPHRRRRRQLAQAERRQSAADVLQPDSHRSADRLAHLRPGRVAARVR